MDSGWLQNFRHFFRKGKNHLINIETDAYELYPTLGGKNSPWQQKSNKLDLL